MERVEFRPWKWVALHEVEGEDSNIGVALDVHSQDFQAVIYFPG
jgi:hypothetical protein